MSPRWSRSTGSGLVSVDEEVTTILRLSPRGSAELSAESECVTSTLVNGCIEPCRFTLFRVPEQDGSVQGSDQPCPSHPGTPACERIALL